MLTLSLCKVPVLSFKMINVGFPPLKKHIHTKKRKKKKSSIRVQRPTINEKTSTSIFDQLLLVIKVTDGDALSL